VRKIFSKVTVVGMALVWGVITTASDSEFSNGEQMSLNDILNLKSSLAAKRELSARETPGIVSVITRDEIMNSGVKNLQEVLNLFIPGMNFGHDVEGIFVMGYRNFWATDGKLLLMIDGLEVVDDLFGNVSFGNHYPVSIIDRVEVVRGPGSAIYGGFAGVAVINVITRTDSIDGVYVASNYSNMKSTYASKDLNLGVGNNGTDYKFNALISGGKGQYTDRNATDLKGNTVNFKDKEIQSPEFADIHAKVDGFDLRFVLDNFPVTHISLDGPVWIHPPAKEKNDLSSAQIKYDFKPSENLVITSKVNYKATAPYSIKYIDEANSDNDFTVLKTTKKWTPGISASWNVQSDLNLLLGVENSYTTVARNTAEPSDVFKKYYGKDSYNLTNFAAYTQLAWDNPIANITLGARYDRSSEYGGQVSPRLAAVKIVDKFHTKGMISQSFRSPGGIIPDRVPSGLEAKNEKGTNVEAELGYQLSDSMFVQANVFNVRFRDLLQYTVSPGGVGGYNSQGVFENQGVETEFRFQKEIYRFIANYSYVRMVTTDAKSFLVPEHKGFAYGQPNHRLNMMGTVNLDSNFSINPSVNYYGQRFYVSAIDDNDNQTFSSLNPQAVANVNFRYKNLFVDNLELDFGVQNITDANCYYTAPYNNNIPAIPGATREFNILVAYTKQL
jgi:outer membrane receptor for ferrienterochelin and colicin